MSNDDDSLKHRLDRGRACLEQLHDPAEGARRAQVVAEGIQRLADYRRFLAAMEGTAAACPRLQGQLGDRAFEAESTFRVMLAEAVRSLNDLQDSGLLHAHLAGFAAALGDGETSLTGMLPQLKEALSKPPSAFPEEFFQELHATLQRHDVHVRHDAKSGVLVVRGKNVAGSATLTKRIRLAPQVGDLGRIGLDQFFGADGSGGLGAGHPIPTPSDCHHDSRRPEVEPSGTVDVYAALLGGLATARESMYRHARKISEFGHGKAMVRANDGLVIGLVGAAVFAIAGLIAGFLSAFRTPGFVPFGPLAASLILFAVAGLILVIIFIAFF